MNLNPIIVQIKARAEQYFAVVHRMGTAIKAQAAVIQAHLNKIKAPNLGPKFTLPGSTIQSIKQASTWSSFLSKNFSAAHQWAGRLASSVGSYLSAAFSKLKTTSSSAFSGMGNMISSMIKNTQAFGNHWINVGKNIRSAGKMMSVYISTPLAMMGAGAVKAFADFDQAVTKTKAFMDPRDRAPENLKAMEAKSIQMATSGQSPFSATDTMDAFKVMSQTGVRAAQSLELIGVMSEFATASEMELGEATEDLLGSLYAFKAASDDPMIMAHNMKRMSDVIVSAASASSASVGEVVRSMGSDAAAAAHQYGMSIEGLGAAITIFAKANKKAENAGHTVGRALRLLTGSFTKNEHIWRKYGINLIDETTGQFVDFGQAIELIENKIGSLTGPGGTRFLAELGLEQLSQKSITPLLGMAKEMKELEEQFKKSGTTSEMAKTMMGSFANQMKMFKNAVMAAGIAIGRMLAPYVIYVMAKLREGMKWVEGWSKSSKELALKIALVAIVLGPVVVGLSIFVSLMGYLALGFAVAASGFFSFIGSLSVFLPLAVFLGVIVQRILFLFGGFDQIIADVWSGMQAFWAWAAPMWNAFASLVTTIMVDLADTIIVFFMTMYQWTSSTLSAVMSYFGVTWAGISATLSQFFMDLEFMWLNAGLVIQLTLLEWTLYWVQFCDEAKYQLTTGLIISVFNGMELMKSYFINAANTGITAFYNMAQNVKKIIENLPGLIAGTTNLEDIWRPLDKGFVEHIPNLIENTGRETSGVEKALTDKVQKQREVLATAYEKFQKDKSAANAVKEQEKVAAEAASPSGVYEGIIKASAHGNEDFIGEIEENTKKGQDALKMSEAALKGSSEALSRIMEYRAGKPIADNSAMNFPSVPSGDPDIVTGEMMAFDALQPRIPPTSSSPSAGSSSPQERMITLLQGILEVNQVIASKPSIEGILEPAGIA